MKILNAKIEGAPLQPGEIVMGEENPIMYVIRSIKFDFPSYPFGCETRANKTWVVDVAAFPQQEGIYYRGYSARFFRALTDEEWERRNENT